MKPRTRLAKFLAKIAGLYEGDITPRTEIEKCLDQIAQSGGGGSGGGGGGVSAVTLYPDMNASPVILYKDKALTQGFATAEEAISFIEDNPLIRIKYSSGGEDVYDIPVTYLWGESDGVFSVVVLTFQDNYRLFIGEPGLH